jgi:hypothetical protein
MAAPDSALRRALGGYAGTFVRWHLWDAVWLNLAPQGRLLRQVDSQDPRGEAKSTRLLDCLPPLLPPRNFEELAILYRRCGPSILPDGRYVIQDLGVLPPNLLVVDYPIDARDASAFLRDVVLTTLHPGLPAQGVERQLTSRWFDLATSEQEGTGAPEPDWQAPASAAVAGPSARVVYVGRGLDPMRAGPPYVVLTTDHLPPGLRPRQALEYLGDNSTGDMVLSLGVSGPESRRLFALVVPPDQADVWYAPDTPVRVRVFSTRTWAITGEWAAPPGSRELAVTTAGHVLVLHLARETRYDEEGTPHDAVVPRISVFRPMGGLIGSWVAGTDARTTDRWSDLIFNPESGTTMICNSSWAVFYIYA